MGRKQSNVKILEHMDELGNIRERLGAKDENDASCDGQINEMTATELCAAWTGWHIGDESWGREVIGMYKNLLAQGVTDDEED